ncbi:MAG: caspase family protein, partial [Chloroflexota bacterium]
MTRKLALIIGNSQYDDANLSQLTAPAADVRALDELLRAPEIGGFDAVQTLENRSFDGVQLAIADFFADKKPDDLLLLYFSGHGLLDPQGRLYLAVKNTRNDRLSGSAIASLFLKDEMDNSRAKRQVLILDCCQSGAFGQGAKGAPGAQAITNATFEGRGRVVLTATDKTQPAWEGNRIIGGVETSIFTHFIVEG